MAPTKTKKKAGGKTRSALQDVVTLKAIVNFTQKAMGTKDVRVDPKLNQAVWARGIKNVPHRMRLKLERKRNDEENAKEKLYTYVSHVPVLSFKGLSTTIVE